MQCKGGPDGASQGSCLVPPMQSKGGLDGGDLDLGSSSKFDPNLPGIKQQLVAKLGISPNACMESLGGFSGGLNSGVWKIRDPQGEYVMKLVQSSKGERSAFLRLTQEHPSITSDTTVAFPIKVFSVKSGGATCHDLVVMPRAPGKDMAAIIGRMSQTGKTAELLQILRKLGTMLAEFHSRYAGKQHGDFQPQNIFYDDSQGGRFTFVDMSGMGAAYQETDLQHFTNSLQLLSQFLGGGFFGQAKQAIEAGYTGAGGHSTSVGAVGPTSANAKPVGPMGSWFSPLSARRFSLGW